MRNRRKGKKIEEGRGKEEGRERKQKECMREEAR
jgi:hypothetical protein